MKRLAGKIALVTGAASGIGAATAAAFADEGARVVCCDIDEKNGAEVINAIRRNGGDAEFAQADVSRSEQVEATVANTVKRFSKIDILMANAGYQFVKPLAEVEENEWDQLMAVNLKGIFLFSKYIIPVMVRAGAGSIIATGSVLSFAAAAGLTPYCVSKAAVMNLVRGIAVEYGKYGVRANCICPGCINTPLAQVFFASQANPELAVQQSAASHALGRIGTPEEVARAAVFLASDESSFVTGSALTVDGGLTAAL